MKEIKFISDIDVQLVQHVGSDEAIVAAARVSTGVAGDKSFGLIPYLMKHRHGSPFEHGMMTFRVHAPIFVWREWHRHRIGHSYNEESGRYKQLEPVFYVPPLHRPMFKVDAWKAGRPKFARIYTNEQLLAWCKVRANLMSSYKLAYKMYEENLALGIDPGLARDCLPVGIYSACYVTVNPRSLMAFLSLRVHEPTAKYVSYPLWEIDQAARKCEQIFKGLYPVTHQAFIDNGRVAP